MRRAGASKVAIAGEHRGNWSHAPIGARASVAVQEIPDGLENGSPARFLSANATVRLSARAQVRQFVRNFAQ
jgi:hypothetical protein